MKKKYSITIGKDNIGSFTKWCKLRKYNGVTSECINDGLKSKVVSIRKKANFARNAKKWNHKDN